MDHELEPWELDEIKGPDCDGARWMTQRGRVERLNKIYKMDDNGSTSTIQES